MDVAIVGCGYWGPNLVRNFVSIPQCRRVVCCDMDQTRLDRIRTAHRNVETTTDLQDIIDDPEITAVAIATPVVTHFDIASRLLQAGKHVLVEKPLAASTQETRALTHIAAENDVVLMVAHTFEYSVALNKAKQIIESGELGTIHYVSLQRRNLGHLPTGRERAVGPGRPHDISILFFLLDAKAIAVNAHAQAFLRAGHPDVATAMVHFSGGTVAFLHDSWLDPNKVRQVTVVGSRKMLVYDDVSMNEKIKIFDKGIEAPSDSETFADFHFSYRYGDITSPRLEEREPLRVQIEHFLECIREGKAPNSDGHSGTRVVEVLEAMEESIRSKGQYVTISGEDAGAIRVA